IVSPDIEATPNYYKNQKYFAWFKLTDLSMDPLSAEVLHQYSYEEVSEFFESGHSRFMVFYGKRIENPEELQDQNRTIWFLRPYQSGDKLGRILADMGQPKEPFSTEPLASHSRTVLWLSDL